MSDIGEASSETKRPIIQQIAASETAVLVIEFQNEFLKENGLLHKALKPLLEETRIVERSAELVRTLRERGYQIVHTPLAFSADYDEIPHPQGLLKEIVNQKALRIDSWGAQIHDDLEPDDGDMVVESRKSLDIFCKTDLDEALRSRDIKNIAVLGVIASASVASTIRGAYDRGYNVYAISDCMLDFSKPALEASVKHTFPLFSRVVSAHDFLRLAP